jgi:pimeloyl-ACP methyl ester carboxylesterase
MAPLIPAAERRHVEIEAVDGPLRVHVAELGEGPPVLMLHGWPQHSGAWRKVAPLMAGSHRLICPDLRGFGASDAPAGGYDAETFAADALALMDALELERAFLVGHDWGGFAGFLACFMAPRRIRAFVCLNAPIPWPRQSARLVAGAWRSWYVLAMASPLGPWALERHPRRIADGIRSDNVHPAISEQDAIDYAARLARPHSRRATQLLYRSYLRALAGALRGPPPPRLTVPTRLLFGMNDRLLSTEVVKGHEGHADDMEVELVEDSGHFIPEEKPELVAERALQLFSSSSAPADASSRTGAP